MGLVINNATANRLGRAGSSVGRGQTIGPPNASQRWTTGRRELTDGLAAQRRVRDDDVAVFAEHTIYTGGADGAGNLTMLHPYAEVQGCVRVGQTGLHYGGDLAHAAGLVREGRACAEEFVFFKGRIDWKPGELRGEREQGEWVLASPAAATRTGDGDGDSVRGAARLLGAAVLPPTEPAGAEPSLRHRRRHEAWARVVASLAAAEAAEGDEPESQRAWQDGLRSWLRMPPLKEEDAALLEAIHMRGRHAAHAKAGSPPPWRTQEDWSAEGW